MKIFFTAATTIDGSYIDQKKAIISQLKSLGHTLTSGEQIISSSHIKEDIKEKPVHIYEREIEALENADCVVAEVSSPSSGVGGEIIYALSHKKPILALFYKDNPNRLSPMIAGNPSDLLFLEHYDDDNIHIVLNRFLDQVKILNDRKGKLIIIDGGDGSGKATQSNLLIQYLTNKGLLVKYLDFPRYYSSFHGRIVGRFLKGEFGKLEQVSPYLASLAYALDRASVKEEMDAWLAKGRMIVSNRYATSNMAHQGARVPPKKRAEFLEWLDELEYKVHKIPREDVVVYLYVPWQIGLNLTAKKGDRGYIGKGQDIAEKDTKHRQEAEKMYLKLARERKNWIMINCVKVGKILSKEEIHTLVVKALKSKNIIP